MTPPASARSHSPARRPWQARWTATQRRRARRVDRQARPLQAEHVREPPGGDAEGVARWRVGVDRLRVREAARGRSRCCEMPDDTRPCGVAGQRARARWPASSSASQATSSSSRCCGSMLGRLARRDAEELGVEAVDPVEEAAVAGGHLARRVGVAVVEGVERPALRRDLGDGVDTRQRSCAKPPRRRAPPGKRQADAHDRDRLARARPPTCASRALSSRISSSARFTGVSGSPSAAAASGGALLVPSTALASWTHRRRALAHGVPPGRARRGAPPRPRRRRSPPPSSCAVRGGSPPAPRRARSASPPAPAGRGGAR